MTTGSHSARVRARWFDRAVVAAYLGASETELALTWPEHTRPVLDAGLAAALAVPLLWRRSAPLAVCVVVMAVTVAAAADPTGVFTLQTATLVAFLPAYAVGAYAVPLRRSVTGLAVCLAGVEAAVAVAHTGPYWAFLAFGMTTASWTVGVMLASQRGLAAALARARQIMRDEHDQFERLALADERERIASELQAIVARCLSTMVVQSQAAQMLLSAGAARAEPAIERIERTGQAALAELRRMLYLLSDEAPGATLAPQPGLGQLRTLIKAARERGWDVEFLMVGEPQPLATMVDVILYRIVEELLTDDPLPADPAAGVALVMRFGADKVSVECSGRRLARAVVPSLAMRERIALANGCFEQRDIDGIHWLRVTVPTVVDEGIEQDTAPGRVESAIGPAA